MYCLFLVIRFFNIYVFVILNLFVVRRILLIIYEIEILIVCIWYNDWFVRRFLNKWEIKIVSFIVYVCLMF